MVAYSNGQSLEKSIIVLVVTISPLHAIIWPLNPGLLIFCVQRRVVHKDMAVFKH